MALTPKGVVPQSKPKKAAAPKRAIGVAEVDALDSLPRPTLQDYVAAASAYIKASATLDDGPKKAAQIRLSQGLGRIIVGELGRQIPRLAAAKAGETRVAGGLRTVNADVSESHELDGLRLAIEVKPVNLAVGRAIWNRFGDIRAFAVNIHLKFPFCVVGGVLTIPTQELVGTKADKEAQELEDGLEKGRIPGLEPLRDEADGPEIDPTSGVSREDGSVADPGGPTFKSTRHLIEKAVERLKRSGDRETEADAAHHLEAICVVAYDPISALIDSSLVPAESGLDWDAFIKKMTKMYSLRFER